MRAGFTLVEVLVTLVLIALLVGVIVPAVINQLDRGDHTRVISDLQGIRSGAKMFRIDVKRYPSTLEQLTVHPDDGTDDWGVWTDSSSLPSGTINTGLKKMWNGPYLEGAAVTSTTDSLETALGARISPVFVTTGSLGGVDYLTIEVNGLSADEITVIDSEFDGGDGDTSGRIQRTGVGTEANPYILNFLVIPLN